MIIFTHAVQIDMYRSATALFSLQISFIGPLLLSGLLRMAPFKMVISDLFYRSN